MRWFWFAAPPLFLIVGGLVWYRASRRDGGAPEEAPRAATAAAGEAAVRQTCSYCHLFPEPDILPRSAWRETVLSMTEFPLYGRNVSRKLSPAAIARWYEHRAPDELTLSLGDAALDPGPFVLRSRGFAPLRRPEHAPAISNVRLVDILGDERLELIACDMRNGLVLLGRPAEEGNELETLGAVPNPARAEIADLDGDGRRDLLVANLGSFLPIDHNLGSVEWLRQTVGGRFQRVTLFERLGRVADVRPSDFDGDGDTDLVVAEFGWRTTGRVLVLENRTDNWNEPQFKLHVVDPRHGAIHVPVADLDGDGRPDFVALLAQEHEEVVACLNRGGFRFEPRVLYRAPHPAWGSSGLELVDLDQDGDLDVLLTNGDTLDDNRAKPCHAVQWLENLGNLRFEPHRLATMYGVHRAEAADLDGDGDFDIAACAWVDWLRGPEARYVGLLWLEQVEPGIFEERVLEAPECRHMTLAAGDYDRDGDVDLAVGNSPAPGEPSAALVDVWENRTRSSAAGSPSERLGRP
jgi:hypothetical protein